MLLIEYVGVEFEDEPESVNNVSPDINKPGEEVLVITKETAKENKIERVKNCLRNIINSYLSDNYNTIKDDVVIPEYTPEEDTEIDTDDIGEGAEEVAEDAE